MNAIRSALIVLKEPAAPDAPEGFCLWCGEEIVLVDPIGGYRFKQRRYHRGDEHEAGEQTCYAEQDRSRCWSARDALRLVALKEKRALQCAGCKCLLVRVGSPLFASVTTWEADHVVPLEDGGVHELANFQALCLPCHVAKTASEARERAQRRRSQVAA